MISPRSSLIESQKKWQDYWKPNECRACGLRVVDAHPGADRGSGEGGAAGARAGAVGAGTMTAEAAVAKLMIALGRAEGPRIEAALPGLPRRPLSEVRLETPVPWPNKVIAYPVNYHDHGREMQAGYRADHQVLARSGMW